MRTPRILVLRPADHAGALATRLRAIGIEPVVVPAVAIHPPAAWDGVDDALDRLASYHWLLFTSASGVETFFARRRARGMTDALPATMRWAAIGPGTAAALAGLGASDPWVPSRYLGEAAGDELPASPGQRVLRIRGEVASPVATVRLRARGLVVDEVVAYRTVEAPPESDGPLQRAWDEGIDAVVFTSASTVRGFARLAQRVHIDDALGGVLIVAIGPVTADAVRGMGWQVDVVAPRYSVDGIIEAIDERRASLAAGYTTS